MTRRDALILRAAVVWTFYVWITRLWNIWRDSSRDAPFKLVHTGLAVVSLAFGVGIWRVAARNRSRTRAAAPTRR